MGGFTIWHWLVVLVIVLAVFGTKKIGNIGADLGKAVRDFKKGMHGSDDDKDAVAKDEQRLKADPVTGEKAGSPPREEPPHDHRES